MKANELRLGNWIKDGNEYEQVTSDHIKCAESGRCEYDPIPINKKWLEKFGFKYSEFEDLHQKNGYDIDIEENLYCHFYIAEYGDWYKDIEYVHEFQNLYFALTGEELTINC